MANSFKGHESASTNQVSHNLQYQEAGYFQFPFIPYKIQVEFMKELYSVLEKGGVGIFESPTGTGKSLSLICGALTWLRDYNEKCKITFDAVEDKIKTEAESSTISSKVSTNADHSEPAWVSEVVSQRAKKMLLDQIKAKQEKEERYTQRLARLRKQKQSPYHKGKRKHHDNELDKIEEQLTNELKEEDNKNDEDSELILTEYHSDGDFSNQDSSSDEEDENEIHVTKIYYCSRTHSQLDQFVKEVKKSPFGNSTRVVSLGSRLNLCINEDVKKLRSITRVNDKCLELQKLKKGKLKKEAQTPKRSKAISGCCFYDHKRLQDYKDLILVDVKDVEELISVGREIKACPYYGNRYAIPIAEPRTHKTKEKLTLREKIAKYRKRLQDYKDLILLVVLPYNMLLHQATREACGIQLKDNIVIIDEAHNLIETISNIHSVEITGVQTRLFSFKVNGLNRGVSVNVWKLIVQISHAHSQLLQYRDKYGSRLKAKNLMYVKQILYILSCFLTCFDKSSLKMDGEREGASNKADAKLFTINDFLFAARIDNVNLFKIKRYCERSMISKKLNGFVDKYNTTLSYKGQLNGEEEYIPASSPLRNIESFLECLTNANKDGRIFLNNQALLSHCSLKFLLLNPAVYFKSVVEEARAVVVAGGTMQPVSEFKQQLLYSCSLSSDDISEFSCGHVISEDRLLPIALARGPSGVDLDFTYHFRDGKEMVLEVSRVLTNLCSVVPCGLVCFFPSYDYKDKVVKQWSECGAFQKIDAKKKIFSEPKKACHVEKTLLDYGNFIKRTRSCHGRSSNSPNGAILLCVIGGKMSEGINFSDDLGRCVVVIGLPYPNIHSPELKEYVAYLGATLGSNAGQQHCENVCMKAVNQSIGRAIRHIDDYSSIVLLDQRYARSSVQKKLPAWISSRLQTHTSFGPAFGALRKFFAEQSIQTKESV